WLMARVLLDKSHGERDAYGATVQVMAGKKRWSRLVNAASSYLSSCDPRVHFGLGSVGKVDAIEVIWPGGTRETFRGGAVDRAIELRQGQGFRKELDSGRK